MARIAFIVSFELPDGADAEDARQYIVDEVFAGCGGRHPDDPMFDLDRSSVRARLVPGETR